MKDKVDLRAPYGASYASAVPAAGGDRQARLPAVSSKLEKQTNPLFLVYEACNFKRRSFDA